MKKIILVCSYITLVVIAFYLCFQEYSKKGQVVQNYFLSQNDQAHVEEDFFLEAVSYWPTGSVKSKNKVRAGIVPHHLLASPMIANFFSRLSSQKVSKVIVFAPDHDEAGKCPVVVKEEYISWFSSTDFVCADGSLIETEHAVVIIKQYTKHYLDSVEFIPILFSNYASYEQIIQVIDVIQNHSDEASIFIGSVDFSHFLSTQQADINDDMTLDFMKNKNYEELLPLDHEYLDSPESVVAIMKIMESSENELSVIAHENSGATSYFEIIW